MTSPRPTAERDDDARQARRRDPCSCRLRPPPARRALITNVGSPRSPPPISSTSAATRPAAATAFSSRTSSSRADQPFIASTSPPIAGQRRRPGDQPVQRGNGPGRHHVSVAAFADDFLGAPANHPAVDQPQRPDDFQQESGPPLQRLHQRDLQIRPGDRQRDPRQPGATADVHHRAPVVDELGDHRRIQHVPRPQPGRLPRTDQPAHARHRSPTPWRTDARSRCVHRRPAAQPRAQLESGAGVVGSAAADGESPVRTRD